ncbi:MAG TPA: hypothetical protein DEF12_08405 [Rhodobacteraceae bacterium]|jgi:hypothetical protein|nr:hypothetical protein [Paracoccaceae bacterium]
MPLPILLALVIGGIATIALLLHLLGLSRRGKIASPEAAIAAWNDDNPNRPARSALLSASGELALIDTEHGPGLVFAMGADLATRPLADARLRPTQRGLALRLPDFTAPRLHLTLAPEERPIWAQRITAP